MSHSDECAECIQAIVLLVKLAVAGAVPELLQPVYMPAMVVTNKRGCNNLVVSTKKHGCYHANSVSTLKVISTKLVLYMDCLYFNFMFRYSTGH